MIFQAVNWGWSEILWVSLIGFALVFVLLVALIFIMKGFGACFRSRTTTLPGKPAIAPQPMISQEEIAADHPQHQAGLFALEFENSRFNPASRPEIALFVGARQFRNNNERLFTENQRT